MAKSEVALDPPDSQLAAESPEEYDKQIRQYIRKRKAVSPNRLAKRTVEEILGDEDQAVGTDIDYLLLLDDCFTALPGKAKRISIDNLLFRKTVDYLERFDSIPVRYAGAEWYHLVDEVLQSSLAAEAPHLAILPLVNAILRLDPSGSTFTSFHLRLIRLCMQTGLHRDALPVLDKTILSFPLEKAHQLDGPFLCAPQVESSGYITINSGLTSKIDYREVQEYYLLGGMIYTALGQQRWHDALLFFEMVMIVPTQNTPTGFMLEAYQKWMVLNLLVHGKKPSIPKAANVSALRTISTAAKPYNALAEMFETNDYNRLSAEIQIGQQVWDSDGNLGLVSQLIEAYQRFFILNLQTRFSSYPLARIDQDQNRAAQFILILMNNGELNAELDLHTREPIVRFLEATSTKKVDEAKLQKRLVMQLARIKGLMRASKRADEKLQTSDAYVAVMKKGNSALDMLNPETSMKSFMGDGPDGDGDEDIMDSI